jgi:hypothetical protein
MAHAQGHDEGVKLDTEGNRLAAARKGAGTRFLIAAALAVCGALLGIIGLLTPGKGAIYGLVSFAASALLLSYAIRQHAKRDDYDRQIEELTGGDAGQPERPSSG